MEELGSKLQKYVNYYVRIVPRKVVKGVVKSNPLPVKGYYPYKFYIYTS